LSGGVPDTTIFTTFKNTLPSLFPSRLLVPSLFSTQKGQVRSTFAAE